MIAPKAWLLLLVVSLAALAGCATPTAPNEAPEDPLDEVRRATSAWSTPEAAEAAGYIQYSPYVAHHGMHYRNKAFANGIFEPTTPPVLVYVMQPDGSLQLGAVEYSLPRATNVPPEGFPGDADVWGVHEASCHFADGLQYPEKNKDACPSVNANTGAPFLLWHGDQYTLHAWVHYDNPEGVFKPANPAVS